MVPVTLGTSSSLTHTTSRFGVTGGTVSLTEPVSNNGIVKGTMMFAILVLTAVIFLLVAAMGMHQTWYGRWHG